MSQPADLVVHAHGDPDAPPLLLLHGLTDSGPSWGDAIQRWSPTWRVLAPDLLGHGASPRFTEEQLRADDPLRAMLDALVRAVEQHADAPVVAVGHSMGGGMAAALGARRPDLVRALVLEDPVWSDESRWSDPEAVVRERLDEARSAAADLPTFLEEGRRHHTGWPAADLEPWARAKADWDLGFGALGTARLDVPWREVALALRVPTLVVTGTGHVIIDEPVREAIAVLGHEQVEVAVVDGAGHCVRRDRTDAFHALVDPWIEQHRG